MTASSPELHPDVGAYSFEYAYKKADSIGRYSFQMRVGDDPNFWLAQRLMPGAVNRYRICAVFECGDAIPSPVDHGYWYECELVVGTSVFRTSLWAENGDDALRRVKTIGGLRIIGGRGARLPAHLRKPQATTWERVKLFIKWHWLRRPVLRFRSPLDVLSI